MSNCPLDCIPALDRFGCLSDLLTKVRQLFRSGRFGRFSEQDESSRYAGDDCSNHLVVEACLLDGSGVSQRGTQSIGELIEHVARKELRMVDESEEVGGNVLESTA